MHETKMQVNDRGFFQKLKVFDDYLKIKPFLCRTMNWSIRLKRKWKQFWKLWSSRKLIQRKKPQFAVFERLVSRKYSNFDEKIDGQNRSCSHNNDWPSKKKSNTVNKISAFSEERNSDVRNTINHYNIRKSLGKRNFWVQTRGGSGRQKSRGW